MSRNSDTVLAFLLGAVTGGIVALLLAPEKGEVTREKIRKGASDLVGKGKDLVGQGTQELREKAGEVSERARGKVHEVAEGARHQIDAVKGAVAEGKEAYRRELDRG